MLEGMERMRRAGLALEGDILVYRGNARELPDMVRDYHGRGLERFGVWLLAAIDRREAAVAREVPRISDVVPYLEAALGLGLSNDPTFIVSLHTPPCTLPANLQRCAFYAPDLSLLVCNPGRHRFLLEKSPIEGGLYFEGCSSCRMRPRCSGARADYVALHGDQEFQPVPA
jgi:hypothetical protein